MGRRKKRNQGSHLRTAFIVVCILAALCSAAWMWFFKRTDYVPEIRRCDAQITKTLARFGIGETDRTLRRESLRHTWNSIAVLIEHEYTVPPHRSLEQIADALSQSCPTLSLGAVKRVTDADSTAVELQYALNTLTVMRIKLTQKIIGARLAIVIDDCGYDMKLIERLIDLNIPLTLAILPNLQYSAQTARAAAAADMEYILHLPMEPVNPERVNLEPNTLLTSMDDATLRTLFEGHLRSVGAPVGINNHMGSQATQDPRMMHTLLGLMHRRDLFFLDSYTTSQSVAEEVARANNVPFLKRDIFIDNENTVEAVTAQLLKAQEMAQKNGFAIAIGHARPATVSALEKILPQLQRRGITFIPVSAGLKHRQRTTP